jgi:hypothetical protein
MVMFGLVAQLVRSGAEEATDRLISVGSEVQVLPGPPSTAGDVAQLGEHLLCKQGVVGSNPIISILAGAALAALGCEADERRESPGGAWHKPALSSREEKCFGAVGH